MSALALLASAVATATATSPLDGAIELSKTSTRSPRLGHAYHGFFIETGNEAFRLDLQVRAQFRYAYPFDTDPVTEDDFESRAQHTLSVNRARLKVRGQGWHWVKFYTEFELVAAKVLDVRVYLEKFEWLRFKAGQWKAKYSRERVISSGEQQLADRSLINRIFTIDRQQGLSLYGHLDGPGIADFNYYASVFAGSGRGGDGSIDENLMYMLRLQWNFLGEPVEFSGSDLEADRRPKGSLALAGVTNRGPFTAFSTAGGGQLPGFPEGDDLDYRIWQGMVETAFEWRGLSWQQEAHLKHIIDEVSHDDLTLVGLYVQGGIFIHRFWDAFPRPLEFAGRYAVYAASDDSSTIREEATFGTNWFFWGHHNKLTMEVSFFDFEILQENEVDGWRFRLQWDISL